MATEVSRTFDVPNGAVVVQVLDTMGHISSHTIYVSGPYGVADVNAAVAGILTASDAQCAQITAKFKAAGWVAG